MICSGLKCLFPIVVLLALSENLAHLPKSSWEGRSMVRGAF